MAENNGQIQTQNPIQVRKVSQLDNFMDYLNSGKVELKNAFFLVSYPTNDKDIPHNYKINLQDFGSLILAYVESELKEIWEHINIIDEHIKNEHNHEQESEPDTETFEYYWNLYGDEINNNLNKIAPWANNNSEYEKIITKWNDILEEIKLKGLI